MSISDWPQSKVRFGRHPLMPLRGLTIDSLKRVIDYCGFIQAEMAKISLSDSREEVANLRPTGRTSRGVQSPKLREGDPIADMNVQGGAAASSHKGEFVSCITSQEYGNRVLTKEFRPTARGRVGVIVIKSKPSVQEIDKMSGFCIVREDEDILMNTAKGVVVRQQASKIPSQSRSAAGVDV